MSFAFSLEIPFFKVIFCLIVPLLAVSIFPLSRDFSETLLFAMRAMWISELLNRGGQQML